jgi:hypothetical protein
MKVMQEKLDTLNFIVGTDKSRRSKPSLGKNCNCMIAETLKRLLFKDVNKEMVLFENDEKLEVEF